MLGLGAVMLVGFVMASSAVAAAGPFWHHRAIGGEGEGAKIEPKAPENFSGKGGEQLFKAVVAGTSVEFASPSVQVSGAIFNSTLQGQIKADIVYAEPRLTKPELKECSVIIGKNNTIVAKGFLTWKWNGTAGQLTVEPQTKEQTVEGILGAATPALQKPSVEKVNLTEGELTTVTLKGTSCGVLAGTFPVSGSYVAFPNRKVDEFSRDVSLRVVETPGTGVFLQHYYDGEGMQGAEVGLKVGGNPAFYFLGQTEVESAQQEVAVFEK
jgi:hypothetical protein